MTASPIVTIADVLAFAWSKPADETYRYMDGRRCAVAQFVREKIALDARVFRSFWLDAFGETHEFDAGIDEAAHGRPRTFGAFADRLEGIGNE